MKSQEKSKYSGEYVRGWNSAVSHIIEYMKDDIAERLEKHTVISTTYIIEKIEAEYIIKKTSVFKEMRL